jgi:hypothetical protein
MPFGSGDKACSVIAAVLASSIMKLLRRHPATGSFFSELEQADNKSRLSVNFI